MAAWLMCSCADAFSVEYATLIAAVLPCFWLYADLGERLHAGEFGARALDPRHPYASWLQTYADPEFAEANECAIGFVTAAAAASDDLLRRRMHRAFIGAAEHERAFFVASRVILGVDRAPTVKVEE